MNNFDELFALRISLQDMYNDECEIIKNLKMHLRNTTNLSIDEINNNIHDFYNSFGVPIEISTISSINIYPTHNPFGSIISNAISNAVDEFDELNSESNESNDSNQSDESIDDDTMDQSEGVNFNPMVPIVSGDLNRTISFNDGFPTSINNGVFERSGFNFPGVDLSSNQDLNEEFNSRIDTILNNSVNTFFQNFMNEEMGSSLLNSFNEAESNSIDSNEHPSLSIDTSGLVNQSDSDVNENEIDSSSSSQSVLNHPQIGRRQMRRINPFFNELTQIVSTGINNGFRDLVSRAQNQNMENVKVTLDESELDGINTRKYKKSDESTSTKCSICLLAFEEDEDISELKCGHIFHTECANEWLKEYSYKCPICRSECGKPKYHI